MTIRKSVAAALGTVAFAGLLIPQASHAIPVNIPRPVISIPRVTVPAVKPAIPTVKPSVSTLKPMPGLKPPVSAALANQLANQRKEVVTLNRNIAAEKKTIAAETAKVAADEKSVKSGQQTLIADLDKGDTKAAQGELTIVEKAELGLRADQSALQKDQAKLSAEQLFLNQMQRQIKASPTGSGSVIVSGTNLQTAGLTQASTKPVVWTPILPSPAYAALLASQKKPPVAPPPAPVPASKPAPAPAPAAAPAPATQTNHQPTLYPEAYPGAYYDRNGHLMPAGRNCMLVMAYQTGGGVPTMSLTAGASTVPSYSCS